MFTSAFVCIVHRFLHEADLIIYVEGGRIQACGPPAEVLPLVEVREETDDFDNRDEGADSISDSNEGATPVSISKAVYMCVGMYVL